jgi:4a-hydroxytetrahydrobiopterin dehydratase|tara:strand:- start:170 stop:466 length:297 start_codon:yes stop_codon:yes gene_type:complete
MSDILDKNEIKENLDSLDGWIIKNNLLYKKFSFKTFMNAFSFMNIIADQSEKVDHHPKLINEYNKVEVELFTHSSNSISNKDFSLARFIDNIYEEIFS